MMKHDPIETTDAETAEAFRSMLRFCRNHIAGTITLVAGVFLLIAWLTVGFVKNVGGPDPSPPAGEGPGYLLKEGPFAYARSLSVSAAL